MARTSRIGQPHVRAQVALACRILAATGHGDLTLGHVSARAPGRGACWVKRAGIGLDEVRPADVALVDFDGRRLRGRLPLHGELVIHTAVYRARPDVGCVIHTHPFYATTIGASDHPLELLLQDSVVLASGVSRLTATPELLVTQQHGAMLVDALGDGRVVLLRHHGVVVVGRTVPEAVLTALALERTARANLLLAAVGGARGIEPGLARRMDEAFRASAPRAQGLWDYLVRTLPARPQGGRR